MGKVEIVNEKRENGQEVNIVKYIDKNNQANYVAQFKKNGKEEFHYTQHADGSQWKTDSEGKKTRIK